MTSRCVVDESCRRAGSALGVYAGMSWAGATSLVVAVSRAMDPSG
jgi:hypothetical protein